MPEKMVLVVDGLGLLDAQRLRGAVRYVGGVENVFIIGKSAPSLPGLRRTGSIRYVIMNLMVQESARMKSHVGETAAEISR